MASLELTELEKAIEKVVYIFSHCASFERNKAMLTTSKFKELVTLQLPNHIKNVGDLEEKMENVNNDQELKLEEYWRLIGELAQEIKREKVGKKK